MAVDIDGKFKSLKTQSLAEPSARLFNAENREFCRYYYIFKITVGVAVIASKIFFLGSWGGGSPPPQKKI